MNSATPWWGTLVVATIGLVGVLVSQWLSGRREETKTDAEHTELNLRRRIEAYSEFLAAFQAVMFAVDGPDVDWPDERRVVPLWNALAKQSFVIQLLSPPEVADTIAELIEHFSPVLELTRQGIHNSSKLRSAYDKVNDAADRLSRYMRKDVVGDLYEPNWGSGSPVIVDKT
jgi:hypothetical protein